MTLHLLRLFTGGTIAAAVVSALALAMVGEDMTAKPIATARADPAPMRLPTEPTAAGPAHSASEPAR